MLYREIIAVCSETHTKHINTLCGQNVELLNVPAGGIRPGRPWGPPSLLYNGYGVTPGG
jgi:hypothetical protein